MAKFYGQIGYAVTKNEGNGVWTEHYMERGYCGDVIKSTRRLENAERINDDFNITNTFSIVADAYAYENIMQIRYIKWLGAKWRVTNVEVQAPRLILSVGGVFNGDQN